MSDKLVKNCFKYERCVILGLKSAKVNPVLIHGETLLKMQNVNVNKAP